MHICVFISWEKWSSSPPEYGGTSTDDSQLGGVVCCTNYSTSMSVRNNVRYCGRRRDGPSSEFFSAKCPFNERLVSEFSLWRNLIYVNETLLNNLLGGTVRRAYVLLHTVHLTPPVARKQIEQNRSGVKAAVCVQYCNANQRLDFWSWQEEENKNKRSNSLLHSLFLLLYLLRVSFQLVLIQAIVEVGTVPVLACF